MQSDHQSQNSPSTKVVSVATYSAEEIIERFQALYDTYNFKELLEGLDLGFFQIFQRRKALRELKVICIALWYTALQRSFPDDAESFFAIYRAKAACLQPNTPKGDLLQERLDIYLGLLRDKGHADFSPISQYLTESLHLPEQSRQKLKMSLLFRDLYTLIFHNLV